MDLQESPEVPAFDPFPLLIRMWRRLSDKGLPVNSISVLTSVGHFPRLPHSLPQTTYSFKSVDGGVRKFGVLALRITSDIVREKGVANSIPGTQY